MQLNSILYAKTLVRKDIASSAAPVSEGADNGAAAASVAKDEKSDEDDFSSKAQIMTLMTTDVDRVSEFSRHLFTLFGTFAVPTGFSARCLIQIQIPLSSSLLALSSCTPC